VGGSRNYWGPFSGDSGEEGIVRIVEAGVVYTRPPGDAGIRVWQQPPGNPQRFEMPWPSKLKPADFLSLEELGHDLGKNPPKSPDDPRLGELDDVVVQGLVRIASRLHERGFRLGLLHPRNVLILAAPRGSALVLPDYGFTWKSSPFKPSWVEGGNFKPLWDREPESQQQVAAPAGETPLPADSDLRTLARLFACVLTGTPARDVPDQVPTTSVHQTKDPAALAGVWQTLAQACRGEFKTASEFGEKLRRFPLSLHVFALPPPPPSRVTEQAIQAPAGKRPTILVLIVAAAVLAGFVALLLWRPWQAGSGPETTTDGIRTSPPNGKGAGENSSILALEQEYHGARPEEQAAILLKMYRAGALSSDPDLRQKEEAVREKLRREFLQQNWLPRYRKAEQVGQELSQRFVSAKQVRSLHEELKRLQDRPAADQTTNAEEKQCLTFSEMRAQELGSVP